MKPGIRLTLLTLTAAVALNPVPVRCQDAAPIPDSQSENLAKQLSNPIAELVSVPFQLNWEDGVGANNDTRFVLNVQPVVPFSISENWNLIGRLIVPFIGQPAGLAPGSQATFGTGDIVASAFFSPTKPGLIWGIGPVLGLPTTSDPLLGSGKWSIGPTAVVLKQKGRLTFGALANHLWSFADSGNTERSDVNQTLLQPFVAYTSKKAVTVNLASEASCNWNADDGQKWTVPLIASVSKVTRLGPFPFSIGVGAGYYLESPDGGPDWKLRTVFTLILPRAK